jgi:hypothetical protein
MPINIGSTVVLIRFPGLEVSRNYPYLFSIFSSTGKVEEVQNGRTLVKWAKWATTSIESDYHLLEYNSKNHIQLLETINKLLKFKIGANVVVDSRKCTVIAVNLLATIAIIKYHDTDEYEEVSIEKIKPQSTGMTVNLKFKMIKGIPLRVKIPSYNLDNIIHKVVERKKALEAEVADEDDVLF